MTNSINYYKIKEEIVQFLRNSDIFTTTVRGATTTSYTATLASSTTAQIAVSNVRNIRSLTIDATPLTYGSDYEIDFYKTESGSKVTEITFSTAQTGDLAISYDYGSDKIHPDFPQSAIKISDFPRIGCDIVSVATTNGGLGNVNRNNITFTVVLYATSKTDLLNYLTTIRQKFIANQTGFYYLGPLVKPIATGPILVNDKGEDKVFQQNIDFESMLKYEIN